jgi:hypothetical protein
MMMTMCLIFERASTRALTVDVNGDVGATFGVGVAGGEAGSPEGWLPLDGLVAVGTAICGADSEQANSVTLIISKDMSRPFFLISAFLSEFST